MPENQVSYANVSYTLYTKPKHCANICTGGKMTPKELDELVEKYNARMNLRVVKHILKNGKQRKKKVIADEKETNKKAKKD